MELYQALHERRSLPQLGLPAPDGTVLGRIFAAAGLAPDHRLLRPWRYLVIQDDALDQLGSLFVVAVSTTDPERAARDADRLRQMPRRAPMIIVAVLVAQVHAIVPEWEQWLSLGASIQNLLLALHGEGYAAMWRTGDLAEHAIVRSGLGLTDAERIGGFLYVGTALADKAAPVGPSEIWQTWSGGRQS